MLRVLLFLAVIALTIYAFVDCIGSKGEEIRHLSKPVWLLLIVLAWVIGPLAWLIVGRERALPWRAGGPGGGRGGGGGRRGGGRRRWVAPDDNPDFLRSLGEERRREARREDRRKGREDHSGSESGSDKEKEKKTKKERQAEEAAAEEELRRREEELRQRDGRDGRGDGDDGPQDSPPPTG